MSEDFCSEVDVSDISDIDSSNLAFDSAELDFESTVDTTLDSVELDISDLELDNLADIGETEMEFSEIDGSELFENLEIVNEDVLEVSSDDTVESLDCIEDTDSAEIETLEFEDESYTELLDFDEEAQTIEEDGIEFEESDFEVVESVEDSSLEDSFDNEELPGSLDIAYDEIQDECVEINIPEREYDEFETAQMLENPEFYETGRFYEQGINEYGFEGTCGPTSQANAINTVLGNNDLTENKVLGIAVDNNLCEITDIPSESGGTTTSNFMELYDKVNESIGDKIDVELYDYDGALSVDEMAQKIDEGSVLNVAVDSATLWGENDHIPGVLSEDTYTDHWITVTGVTRDSLGKIEKFDIIDSGGGVDSIDADTYQRMCFGEDGREMLDPTCIVVSKKDME